MRFSQPTGQPAVSFTSSALSYESLISLVALPKSPLLSDCPQDAVAKIMQTVNTNAAVFFNLLSIFLPFLYSPIIVPMNTGVAVSASIIAYMNGLSSRTEYSCCGSACVSCSSAILQLHTKPCFPNCNRPSESYRLRFYFPLRESHI